MARSRFYLVSNFLSGVGAAHNLLVDAIEQRRSYIEQVCLAATLIDGLLRLSLVMKMQLETGKDIVDPVLLFQAKRQRKYLTERKVYEKARQEKIITKKIESVLNSLYNQRNIIVHRYLISDIKTQEVIVIAKKYIRVYIQTKEKHREIHNKLVNENVGMAKKFITDPTDDQIKEQILRKHLK